MIDAKVVGDAAVVARLGALPLRVRLRVAEVLEKLGLDLYGLVEDNLNGSVLRRRTGRLAQAQSIRREDGPDTMTRAVGFNRATVPYGAAHEFGFHGTVGVREHSRRQTMAFGRPITPREVMVRAHDMRMNLPERSFLRSALRALAPEAIAQLEAAVFAAAAE